MPFVHRWDEFLRAVDGDQNSDTARHLQLLRSALEPELQVAFNTICDFEAHGAIEFNQLWMIFNPGSVRLALPGGYKDLLTAFARSQHRVSAQFDDVIKGKGISYPKFPEAASYRQAIYRTWNGHYAGRPPRS